MNLRTRIEHHVCSTKVWLTNGFIFERPSSYPVTRKRVSRSHRVDRSDHFASPQFTNTTKPHYHRLSQNNPRIDSFVNTTRQTPQPKELYLYRDRPADSPLRTTLRRSLPGLSSHGVRSCRRSLPGPQRLAAPQHLPYQRKAR